MQSIDSIVTYACGTKKYLLSEKQEIKRNNIIKNWLTLIMLRKKKLKEHNLNWLQIPDHSYRIIIIAGSGSGKINSFLI